MAAPGHSNCGFAYAATNDEIAEALGLTVAQVVAAECRALKKLRAARVDLEDAAEAMRMLEAERGLSLRRQVRTGGRF